MKFSRRKLFSTLAAALSSVVAQARSAEIPSGGAPIGGSGIDSASAGFDVGWVQHYALNPGTGKYVLTCEIRECAR